MAPRVAQPKGVFMFIQAPNYTQIPNELLDDWLPLLGQAELKVLLVIMRKTFGWHKIRDRISLTQLEKITGLERRHVCKAVKKLQSRNLIVKTVVGENGLQQTFYELFIEDSNKNYQCPSTTPTSVFAIPTKETLTKEKKEKREEASPPPLPKEIFSYTGKESGKTRIWMDAHLYKNLLKDFGEDKVFEKCERLDEYADLNPKRFKGYSCHAVVIRKWIREDNVKNPQSSASPEKDKQLTEVICKNFPKKVSDGEIILGYNYIEFRRGYHVEVIQFGAKAFKEQVINQLRKRNLRASFQALGHWP